VFAEVVRDLGGALEVPVPVGGIPRQVVGGELDPLFVAAAEVGIADGGRAGPEPRALGIAMVARVQALVAIWDWRAPVEDDDLRAVVAAADGRRLPVSVVWPPGAARAPASVVVGQRCHGRGAVESGVRVPAGEGADRGGDVPGSRAPVD
jgi:hypothetical protein